MTLATLLLSATLATASYTGVTPATKNLPAFNVQVEETKGGFNCLGIGYTQKVTINLENHPIARVVVEDKCANENTLDEQDIITIYKPGTFGEEMIVCSSCDEETFVRSLYPKAKQLAWEQNREKYMQAIAQKIVGQVRSTHGSIRDKTRGLAHKISGVFVQDDNGVKRNGKTQHTVVMSYSPKGDRIFLSYAQIDAKHSVSKAEESALVMYVIQEKSLYFNDPAYLDNQKIEQPYATVFYDTNMNGEVNTVVELPMETINGKYYFDKSVKKLEEGEIKPRAPSEEERTFFSSYMQDLALERNTNGMSIFLEQQKRLPLPMDGTERRR